MPARACHGAQSNELGGGEGALLLLSRVEGLTSIVAISVRRNVDPGDERISATFGASPCRNNVGSKTNNASARIFDDMQGSSVKVRMLNECGTLAFCLRTTVLARSRSALVWIKDFAGRP